MDVYYNSVLLLMVIKCRILSFSNKNPYKSEQFQKSVRKSVSVATLWHHHSEVFKSRVYISVLLNNGVTQWRFRGTSHSLFLYFSLKYDELHYKQRTLFSHVPCLYAKSETGLRINKQQFFLVLTDTVLYHSALFCALHFGMELRSATSHSQC